MIIVTGAAGFIGSNLCRALHADGISVIGVDDFSFGSSKNVINGITFINGRFEDFTRIRFSGHYSFSEDDILVHLATANLIYSQEHPLETITTNCINTLEFFKHLPCKIVYASTSSVYGDASVIPTTEDAEIKADNFYSISKRAVELYLEKRGNYTTLRLSNVYGPGQRPENPYCGVVGRLIEAAYSNDKKQFSIYGDGSDTRDFTYIDDVVNALVRAIFMPALCSVINIGSTAETRIVDLIDEVRSATGKNITTNRLPPRSIDKISRRCLSIDRAVALLRYSPKTDLRQGLKKTAQWYQGEGIF